MKWLRKRLLRWLGFEPTHGDAIKGENLSPLPMMAHWENPKAMVVVPVKNGFLICNRVYNPNGPDPIEATYAPDAAALGPLLIAEMTAMRLKK